MLKLTRLLAVSVTVLQSLNLSATPQFAINGGVLMAVELNGATEVDIPNGVTGIGDNVFWHMRSLRRVTIPNGVISIGHNAFYDCTSLCEVNIPDGVKTIGDWAFKDCRSLASITIPNSVTRIGGGAFDGCGFSYTGGYGYGNFAGYYSGFHATLTVRNGELIEVVLNGAAEVTIPDSVTRIRYDAFDDCDKLLSVQIPSSVTQIDDGAFRHCCRLASVAGIPQHALVDDRSLDRYFECGELTNAVVASGVTNIGTCAFGCCGNLESVTLPDSVMIIGERAFENCRKLINVTIGSGLTNVGERAFCDSLNRMILTMPQTITCVPRDAIADCLELIVRSYDPCEISGPLAVWELCRDELRHVTPNGATNLIVPSFVGRVESGAFDECDELERVQILGCDTCIQGGTFRNCRNLTDVVVQARVVGFESFSQCGELKTVTLGRGVKLVEERAFQGCRKLMKVDLSDSLTCIGAESFSGCECLADLSIGRGVTNIGQGAFRDCEALSDLRIPGTVSCIECYAFENCRGLSNLIIGDGDGVIIGEGAFCDCYALESVALGNGVSNIGVYAFFDCTNLSSVRIQRSVTRIGVGAFSHCSRLAVVYVDGGDEERVRSLYDWPFDVDFVETATIGIDGDSEATVFGDPDMGYVIKPSEGNTAVEVTIPQGVDAAKVTVEVSPMVASVKPNGAKVKVVNGGADITEFLNVPAANGNGVIDLTKATVKEEIVKEAMDAEKGAKIVLDAANLSLTTPNTRVGLFYQLREGVSIEGMSNGDSTIGDGKPWTPEIKVKGGNSAFYSIGVGKGE